MRSPGGKTRSYARNSNLRWQRHTFPKGSLPEGTEAPGKGSCGAFSAKVGRQPPLLSAKLTEGVPRPKSDPFSVTPASWRQKATFFKRWPFAPKTSAYSLRREIRSFSVTPSSWRQKATFGKVSFFPYTPFFFPNLCRRSPIVFSR